MFSKHYLYIVHGTSSWNISVFICFLSVTLKSNIPIMFEEWYISLKFTYPIKMFHKVLKNTKGSSGTAAPWTPWEQSLIYMCVGLWCVIGSSVCVCAVIELARVHTQNECVWEKRTRILSSDEQMLTAHVLHVSISNPFITARDVCDRLTSHTSNSMTHLYATADEGS